MYLANMGNTCTMCWQLLQKPLFSTTSTLAVSHYMMVWPLKFSELTKYCNIHTSNGLRVWKTTPLVHGADKPQIAGTDSHGWTMQTNHGCNTHTSNGRRVWKNTPLVHGADKPLIAGTDNHGWTMQTNHGWMVQTSHNSVFTEWLSQLLCKLLHHDCVDGSSSVYCFQLGAKLRIALVIRTMSLPFQFLSTCRLAAWCAFRLYMTTHNKISHLVLAKSTLCWPIAVRIKVSLILNSLEIEKKITDVSTTICCSLTFCISAL